MLRSIKGPWIVAGDFNLTPAVLVASNWPKMVGGIVFATQLPTCNDSTVSVVVNVLVAITTNFPGQSGSSPQLVFGYVPEHFFLYLCRYLDCQVLVQVF